MSSLESLVHVVLIAFRDNATEAQKEEVCNRYQTLAEEVGGIEAGIQYFAVQKNLDTRKGIALVELAVFKDNDAFRTFLAHPRHVEIQAILRTCADWWVGDYNDVLSFTK